jgi:hypothetical protein
MMPVFHSGLGNQLFQFGANFAFSKKTNRKFLINREFHIQSSHSDLNYFDTIFSKAVARCETNYTATHVIYDMDHSINDILHAIRNASNIIIAINGYFQEESNIRGYRNEIIAALNIPAPTTNVPAELERCFFIHYRRGDYIDTAFLKDLEIYHRNAIERVKSWCNTKNIRPKFIIISDDIAYYRENPPKYLAGLEYEYLDGLNEIDTLWVMKSCGLGGACANSTFSWWGLYLNYTRPLLFVPDIPDLFPKEKFAFLEATPIEVIDT